MIDDEDGYNESYDDEDDGDEDVGEDDQDYII